MGFTRDSASDFRRQSLPLSEVHSLMFLVKSTTDGHRFWLFSLPEFLGSLLIFPLSDLAGISNFGCILLNCMFCFLECVY